MVLFFLMWLLYMFVFKLCDIVVLLSVFDWLLWVCVFVQDEQLCVCLGGVFVLFKVFGLYLELQWLNWDFDVSMVDVVEVIEYDVVLIVEIFKLMNLVFFGLLNLVISVE